MLHLTITDKKAMAKICHALSTELRLDIIDLLQRESCACQEIAEKLRCPLSTVSANVKILEEAGLILTELLPGKNGLKKRCSLVYLDAVLHLSEDVLIPRNSFKYERSVPIGNYMDCRVSPSCGFLAPPYESGVSDAHFDDPNYFFDPSRIGAQLLWFREGYVEYKIPVYQPLLLQPESISFSMELCSEAPGFNSKWKSDITLWINGVETGTWTCPADFGDRRGKLTPKEWGSGNTQYGILKEWCVTGEGAYLDGEPLSDVCLSALSLEKQKYVTLRIGVKPGSEHVGGVNLFGSEFGDYPQDICMCIRYKGNSRRK